MTSSMRSKVSYFWNTFSEVHLLKREIQFNFWNLDPKKATITSKIIIRSGDGGFDFYLQFLHPLPSNHHLHNSTHNDLGWMKINLTRLTCTIINKNVQHVGTFTVG